MLGGNPALSPWRLQQLLQGPAQRGGSDHVTGEKRKELYCVLKLFPSFSIFSSSLSSQHAFILLFCSFTPLPNPFHLNILSFRISSSYSWVRLGQRLCGVLGTGLWNETPGNAFETGRFQTPGSDTWLASSLPDSPEFRKGFGASQPEFRSSLLLLISCSSTLSMWLPLWVSHFLSL